MFQKSDTDAVIVAACRTPVGRIGGALSQTRPDDLGAAVIKNLLQRVPQLDPHWVDDVIFGCAMPQDVQGMNVARIISLLADLPVTVPAQTINRFCSSGLQAISLAADRINANKAEVIIAGGVESMSMVPMQILEKVPPNPTLLKIDPGAYITTIGGAEVLRKKYSISRQEQDQFALESHQKAVQAQDARKFVEEILPVKIRLGIEPVKITSEEVIIGSKGIKEILFENDEGPRRNTSLEKLAKLEPIEKDKDSDSTVTAGNASQMSDGAAAVVIMSRRFAKRLGIKPMACLVDYVVTGVRPEFFGIGPVYAIRYLLQRSWLKLNDVGLIELNEAFAVQALAVLRDLPLSRDILNVNGGAIALGHPLGCSGARIAATLIYEMRRRGVEYGLEAMCIGGGMGAAGLFRLED
ncbi:MAG: thiolase family protein [Candidatus Yanofskybacteria bacterium]|nr:thiolase family protein [Candidatus Yanofskybacteria bacterium]